MTNRHIIKVNVLNLLVDDEPDITFTLKMGLEDIGEFESMIHRKHYPGLDLGSIGLCIDCSFHRTKFERGYYRFSVK